jgi:TonB family protein
MVQGAPPLWAPRVGRDDQSFLRLASLFLIVGGGLFFAFTLTPPDLHGHKDDLLKAGARARMVTHIERARRAPVSKARSSQKRPAAPAKKVAHIRDPGRLKGKPGKKMASKKVVREILDDLLPRGALTGPLDALKSAAVTEALGKISGPTTALAGAGGSGLGLRDTGAGGGGQTIGIGHIKTRGGGPWQPGGQGLDLGAGTKRGPDLVIDKRGEPQPGLQRGEIQRVVNRARARIRHCYERAMQKEPNLRGKVAYSWIIDAQGRVGGLQTLAGSLNNPGLGQCLERVIRTLRFPPPRGGGVVQVSYPFVFSN